jgi:hypothetical protein
VKQTSEISLSFLKKIFVFRAFFSADSKALLIFIFTICYKKCKFYISMPLEPFNGVIGDAGVLGVLGVLGVF